LVLVNALNIFKIIWHRDNWAEKSFYHANHVEAGASIAKEMRFLLNDILGLKSNPLLIWDKVPGEAKLRNPSKSKISSIINKAIRLKFLSESHGANSLPFEQRFSTPSYSHSKRTTESFENWYPIFSGKWGSKFRDKYDD
jgi:hypothetical protein